MVSLRLLRQNKLVSFLVRVFLLYISWYSLYEFYLKPDGSLDHVITEYITQSICFLLEHTGYTADYTIARRLGETYIYMNEMPVPVVRVGASCNGLEPIVLFMIFIIAYPGKWYHKLWYIPLCVLIIHGINIIRNYVLTLMAFHHNPHYELYHRYVFVLFVYLVIFGMWVLWTRFFNPKEQQA